MQNMEQIMNNGSSKEENYELYCKMETTKQKCHICDSHFENLDFHFLTSHEPIGNSNYETLKIGSEDAIDPKKEPFHDSLGLTGLQCYNTDKGNHCRKI